MSLYTHEADVKILLDGIDQMRSVLASEDPIALPSIAVIGDQSSGKSSVLEALSEVNMPRGQGCCTRCPLVVSVRSLPKGQKRYAKIGMQGSKLETVYEFDKLGPKITELTNRSAGTRKEIGDKAISLYVFREDAVDLTIIDLPGVTRVPVAGQPRDIYEQIKRMYFRFITSEETVILNVIPADIDFSTSESLKLSREVDPEGIRTIAVVTKIDKCEKGIKAKIEGTAEDSVKLKLGYVAVRNRTQEEIDAGMSHSEARAKERAFFEGHPELRTIPQKYKGTEELAKKLATILSERINATLPTIRAQVQQNLVGRIQDLESLGQGVVDENDARITFMQRVSAVDTELKALFKAEYESSFAQRDKKLHIAPRLFDMFVSYHNKVKKMQSDFVSRGYAEHLRNAIKETRGAGLENFLSRPVFNGLVLEECQNLAPISALLNVECRTYIGTVIDKLIDHYIKDFPDLKQKVKQCSHEMLDKYSDICRERIEELVEKQCDVLTLNEYYENSYYKIKDSVLRQERGRLRPEVGESSRGEGEKDPKDKDKEKDGKEKERGRDREKERESQKGRDRERHREEYRRDSPNSVDINDFKLNLTPLLHVKSEKEGLVRDMQIHMLAYWKVVEKRVVDGVCMEIKYRYTKGLKKNYSIEILQHFKDPAELYKLMVESKDVGEERKRISESMNSLKQAWAVLCGITGGESDIAEVVPKLGQQQKDKLFIGRDLIHSLPKPPKKDRREYRYRDEHRGHHQSRSRDTGDRKESEPEADPGQRFGDPFKDEKRPEMRRVTTAEHEDDRKEQDEEDTHHKKSGKWNLFKQGSRK